MENMRIRKKHRVVLWCVSAIGLFGINGVFFYSVIFKPELIEEAIGNIYAMVFIVEAFLLLSLLCFLIAIAKLKKPNWVGFLALSLIGSLAFSIPLSILLWTRDSDISI